MKPGGGGARLTQGPVGKSILSMMLPMMTGMVAMISYTVANTWFVAQIGTMELAAVSFTIPVNFVVGAITLGLGIGTASVAARLFGAGKRDDVERVTLHAILLGVVTGAIVILAGLLTIDPLFTAMGADEDTLPLIRRYMRIYYWGGIFLVIPMITNAVLRASGDARTPAAIMAMSAVLNVALDPIFIFGLFGVPRLELRGAAIATVVAASITMLVSLLAICYGKRLITFRSLYAGLMLDSWRRILHVGIPSMTSNLVAPLTTAFITWQVAEFGQEAVAGFGIASRLEGLAILALMALSGAMTPFVGQCLGAGDHRRVQEGVGWSYRFSLSYGLAVAAVLALGAPLIAGLFTEDATATNAAVLHMRIVPVSYLALGMAMAAIGSFNGSGKPWPAMVVSLSRTILVYAPLALLLAKLFGLVGIFAAACVANYTAGGIGVAWWRIVAVRKGVPRKGDRFIFRAAGEKK